MPIARREYTIQVPDVLDSLLQYFKSSHSIAGIEQGVLVKWGCIVAIWMLIAFWHQHQNKTFHEYIRNAHKRTPVSDRLSQLAYNRTYELLGVFFLLLLMVVFYDTRVYSMESRMAKTRQEAVLLSEELLTTRTALTEAQQAQISAPQSGEEDATMAQALDSLKQRYEELFINYYYLKRCGRITPTEFHLMNAGLVHELTQLNAPAGVRQNILTAAKGTHDEMYAEASCEAEATDPMQEQIQTYLHEVVQTLPDE